MTNKIEELQNKLQLQKEEKVIVSIKSVSKSGMTRKMDFYVIRDNEMKCINNFVSLFGYSLDKNHHVIVRGCGMDMVFAVLYPISRNLFGDYNTKFSNSYQLI